MSQTADVVICGVGMTGVAAAHFLSRAGMPNILILDERPSLSFTTGPRSVIVTGGQMRRCWR